MVSINIQIINKRKNDTTVIIIQEYEPGIIHLYLTQQQEETALVRLYNNTNQYNIQKKTMALT